MKYSSLLIALVILAGCTGTVDFKIDESRLRGGDDDELSGATNAIRVGKSYAVRGSWTLNSRERGRLYLWCANGEVEVFGERYLEIKKGSGAFDFRFRIKKAGYLHLSMYPPEGGSSFTSLYFGQEGQLP